MISDILFEAIEEIRTYQRDMPGYYDDMKNRIDAVLEQMESLQRELDAPPALNTPTLRLEMFRKVGNC